MKLSEIKTALKYLKKIEFVLPNGDVIPPHFHVTEVGKNTKHFIDCGGVVRTETTINFQLFTAADYDHRLSTEKLSSIIEHSQKNLELEDAEIEVEYQGNTIEKFNLAFINGRLQLKSKMTDCLAKDKCGIPQEKEIVEANAGCCTPGSGCC